MICIWFWLIWDLQQPTDLIWLSVLCRVCHVFPPHVSIFGLFPVLVSCHYELSMFQLCFSRYVLITLCILVLSFEFDFVWSTRYSRCFLSVSLALSCHVYVSVCPCSSLLCAPWQWRCIILRFVINLHYRWGYHDAAALLCSSGKQLLVNKQKINNRTFFQYLNFSDRLFNIQFCHYFLTLSIQTWTPCEDTLKNVSVFFHTNVNRVHIWLPNIMN